MRSNSRDHDSHGHTIFLENQLRTMEVCQRDLYKKRARVSSPGYVPPVLGSLVRHSSLGDNQETDRKKQN
jgi:hypothetical protein